MKAYKAFNADLTCTRGKGVFQYVPGETVREEHSKCVSTGLHCAEYPADCFSYYSPTGGTRFFIVEAAGDIDEDDSDTKIACTELTLVQELTMKDMFYETVEWIYEHPKRKYELSAHGVEIKKDEAVLRCDGGFAIARGQDPKVKSLADEGYLGLIVEDPVGMIIGIKLLEVGKAGVVTGKWYDRTFSGRRSR